MSDSVAPAVSTPAPSPHSFVTDDGFRIDSNSSSTDDIKTALENSPKPAGKEPEKKEPDPSEAASVLGKKGGEASAAARKIKPIPPKKEAKEEPAEVEQVEEPPVEAKAEVEEEPEKPLGKPRNDPRARMLEATREAAEAKRERDFYRSQYEAAVAEREAMRRGEPKAQEPKQERERPPFKPEDFEDYEAYLDARDDWRKQQWEAELSERTRVDAYASQLNQAVSGFNERIQKAFGAEYEDRVSEEVRSLLPSFALQPNESVGPLNIVADEIISSDQAPGLMSYLSEHPDVFQRLATLPSPLAVQREMAKIEARLEAQAEVAAAGTPTPVKAISKAHPPARPVAGAPTSAEEITGEESYEEYVAKMNARERRGKR